MVTIPFLRKKHIQSNTILFESDIEKLESLKETCKNSAKQLDSLKKQFQEVSHTAVFEAKVNRREMYLLQKKMYDQYRKALVDLTTLHKTNESVLIKLDKFIEPLDVNSPAYVTVKRKYNILSQLNETIAIIGRSIKSQGEGIIKSLGPLSKGQYSKDRYAADLKSLNAEIMLQGKAEDLLNQWTKLLVESHDSGEMQADRPSAHKNMFTGMGLACTTLVAVLCAIAPTSEGEQQRKYRGELKPLASQADPVAAAREATPTPADIRHGIAHNAWAAETDESEEKTKANQLRDMLLAAARGETVENIQPADSVQPLQQRINPRGVRSLSQEEYKTITALAGEDLPTTASTLRKYDFSSRGSSINAIIAECKEQGLKLPAQIAYVLATVQHETANTFQPVREGYWKKKADKWRKDNLRYYPYYGRGFVQLTWKHNYDKYADLLEMDLVKEPDLVLEPNLSVFVLVHGFIQGNFTGKGIGDYINSEQKDYKNARRCINGTDKAKEIAKLAEQWEGYLNGTDSMPMSL